jgi:chemotaxis response regulator CheB
MPGSIAKAGYAAAILYPREIAMRIAASVRQR